MFMGFRRTDYMNTNKLAQDHPCVIDIIRRHFLHSPSPSGIPYNMTSSLDPNGDPSPGQVPIILRLLKNQVYINYPSICVLNLV